MPTTFDEAVTATLVCGHLTTITANQLMKGEPVDCWACSQHVVRPVQRAIGTFRPMGDGWNFKCLNCGYKRSYGAGVVTCSTKATSHAVRKHHTVRIYIDTLYTDEIRINQPTLGEAAPF